MDSYGRASEASLRLQAQEAGKRRPSRPRATPQWGWSGVQVIKVGHTSQKKLRQIVRQLPGRRSSIKAIAAKIRGYGARFHGNLAQDEYGPTRAERAWR